MVELVSLVSPTRFAEDVRVRFLRSIYGADTHVSVEAGSIQAETEKGKF